MVIANPSFIDASVLTQEESLNILSRDEDNVDIKRKILQVFASLTSEASCLTDYDVKEIPLQIIPDVPSLVVEQVFCFPLDWLVFRASGLNYEIWKKTWNHYLNEYSLIGEIVPRSRSQLLRETYLAALQAEGMIPLVHSTKVVLSEAIKQYLWSTSHQFKMPSIVDIQGHVNMSLKEILKAFKLFSYSNMLQCRHEINIFNFGEKIIIGKASLDNSSSSSTVNILETMGICIQKPWIAVPITQNEMIGAWVAPPGTSIVEDEYDDNPEGEWLDLVEEVHYWINPNRLVFPEQYKVAIVDEKPLIHEIVNEESNKDIFYWKMEMREPKHDITAAVANSDRLQHFLHRSQFHVSDCSELMDSEKFLIQSSKILKPVVGVSLIEPRNNMVIVIEPSPWQDFRIPLLKDDVFTVIFPSGYALRTCSGNLVIFTSVYQRHQYLMSKWLKIMKREDSKIKITMRKCLLNPFSNPLFSLDFFKTSVEENLQ